MYICVDCRETFDEPYEYEERHPYGDTYASEYFAECPHCGGSFEEAVKCDDCWEYVPISEVSKGICMTCVEKKTRELAEAFCSRMTEEEYDNLPEEVLDNFWETVEQVYADLRTGVK